MLRFIRSTAMKIIILVFVALAVAFCFKFPHKVITAKNMVYSYYHVYKGDKLYRKKDLIGAINEYRRALEYYPKHANANYNLANILAVYEDYINALDYYENAVKYRPKFMNARIALGILLSEKFYEYDRAIKEYNLALDKKNIPFSFNIPLIYINKNYIHYNKAVAHYNKGLAYKWRSLMYGLTKEEAAESLRKAVASYKEAIKIEDDMYDAYFNLAVSLHLLGDLDEAKKMYCKCINRRPFDYDAHYNMAILLREQNQFFDAILELEKAALIIDAEGDGYKSRYIYDVLNETSAKIYAQDDFAALREKLDKDPLRSYEPTFVNGKIVASEELDKAILKNMRTCGACK